MATQRICLIMVILLVLPFTVLFSQQLPGYFTVPDIKVQDPEGRIELLDFSHRLFVPFSPEQGGIIGGPVVTQVVLTKPIDEATPQLLNAYYGQTVFPDMSVTFTRFNPEIGDEEPAFLIELQEVRITAIENEHDAASENNTETITLAAKTYRWTDILKGIDYKIDPTQAAAKPQDYNPNIGKVYFYDANGDLIEGPDMEVNYSSRISDFNLRSYLPVDQTGRPTGKIIDQAYFLQKEIDATSPRLIEYLYEANALQKITLALERMGKTGKEEYMWYDFEDVFILEMDMQTLSPEDQAKTDFPFVEDISFTSRRVAWRHIDGSEGSSDNPNFAEYFTEQDPDLPTSVHITSYPNPFNARTHITYRIPQALLNAPLRIAVYDIGGRLINTLFDGPATSATGSVGWDATDLNRQPVASGTYFFLVQTGENLKTGKVVHLK